MPRSLQREAEDAEPEYVAGRFAREGENAAGGPTPTRRDMDRSLQRRALRQPLTRLPKQPLYKTGTAAPRPPVREFESSGAATRAVYRLIYRRRFPVRDCAILPPLGTGDIDPSFAFSALLTLGQMLPLASDHLAGNKLRPLVRALHPAATEGFE